MSSVVAGVGTAAAADSKMYFLLFQLQEKTPAGILSRVG